jgi:hypothetical protein
MGKGKRTVAQRSATQVDKSGEVSMNTSILANTVKKAKESESESNTPSTSTLRESILAILSLTEERLEEGLKAHALSATGPLSNKQAELIEFTVRAMKNNEVTTLSKRLEELTNTVSVLSRNLADLSSKFENAFASNSGRRNYAEVAGTHMPTYTAGIGTTQSSEQRQPNIVPQALGDHHQGEAGLTNVSRRATVSHSTIVGRRTDTESSGTPSLKAKTEIVQKYPTQSLYLCNVQKQSTSNVREYITGTYKSMFRENLAYIKVYPLVTLDPSREKLESLDAVEATAFRVVVCKHQSAAMLDGAFWPTAVRVREWIYHPRPYQTSDAVTHIAPPVSGDSETSDDSTKPKNTPSNAANM